MPALVLVRQLSAPLPASPLHLGTDVHVRDNFDKDWAGESLSVSGEVFDLAWLVVLSILPRCVPLLTDPNTFRFSPRSRVLVECQRGAGIGSGI